MKLGVISKVVVAALVLLLWVPSTALACEACFGAADAAATRGMNNAILFLLGVIGVVQVGFVAMFWEFRRRRRSVLEKKSRFRVLQGGLS